jgi:hypothetical protein
MKKLSLKNNDKRKTIMRKTERKIKIERIESELNRKIED